MIINTCRLNEDGSIALIEKEGGKKLIVEPEKGELRYSVQTTTVRQDNAPRLF